MFQGGGEMADHRDTSKGISVGGVSSNCSQSDDESMDSTHSFDFAFYNNTVVKMTTD